MVYEYVEDFLKGEKVARNIVNTKTIVIQSSSYHLDGKDFSQRGVLDLGDNNNFVGWVKNNSEEIKYAVQGDFIFENRAIRMNFVKMRIGKDSELFVPIYFKLEKLIELKELVGKYEGLCSLEDKILEIAPVHKDSLSIVVKKTPEEKKPNKVILDLN